MNKRLLVTRPKHDITTHYLFYWARKALDLAKKKGITVLDLAKERANRATTSSMLQKQRPSLVFFNGHGNDNYIAGQDNEVLIESGKNEQLLESKIIYALSCRAGKRLGPESIQAGTLAFIGYDKDFVFLIDEDKIGKPTEDATAKLFLEPSNQVMFSLLKGHNTTKAHIRSKNSFRQSILKVVNSESSDNYLVPYLLWDMNHQVKLGDGGAVFN